jgi:nucleotide-binding universal stress UspA family protein
MPRFERILVATDFSPASDAALEYARTLARQFGSSLNLVHVFDDPFTSGAFVGDGTVMMPMDLRETLLESAGAQLADRHAAHAETLRGSSTDLLIGASAKSIVEHAQATHADLIVMGTHGRTGLPHLLLGSVAERVVRTATCPVLTTRDSGAGPT